MSFAQLREAHGEPSQTAIPALDHCIRTMASRWQYSAEELGEALAEAAIDPKSWLRWIERDERDFGGCRSPDEFAARYTQLRISMRFRS